MGRRTQIISVSPPLNVFILEKPKLESLRDEIDQIDEQVVNLLNKRVRAAAEIGKIKHEMGVDPYDPSREEQVFEKIEGLNEGSIPHDSLRAIYREVISSSIALEKDLTIGFLGPEATFTHQAAMLNFGSALSYRSLPDIPDVFQAVEKGECDYGVVPIENSTEGAVNRSLDLLVDTELTIIAQVYLKIEHCLFSPSSLDKIVEVRSKDQALAQCGEWLRRNLPNARLIPVTSTAEAVRESAKGEGIAAIAGKLAGEAHGVPMIDSGIQDRKDNVTRFLVVSRNPSAKRDGVSYRTSLVLSLPDQVGALQSSLNPFSSRGINLCKIESRPSKRKTWDYFFFVDFLGHAEDEEIREALNEVSEACPYHRILGSYPETKL
ncbi:MAG: prephenate dehydratase [Verrucomicrobiota bacterium]|nr:prephenate dehydratase [Verrucomicrobiota bacterium]